MAVHRRPTLLAWHYSQGPRLACNLVSDFLLSCLRYVFPPDVLSLPLPGNGRSQILREQHPVWEQNLVQALASSDGAPGVALCWPSLEGARSRITSGIARADRTRAVETDRSKRACRLQALSGARRQVSGLPVQKASTAVAQQAGERSGYFSKLTAVREGPLPWLPAGRPPPRRAAASAFSGNSLTGALPFSGIAFRREREVLRFSCQALGRSHASTKTRNAAPLGSEC